MPDMLVNLLNLPEDPSLFQRLAEDGVRIFRARAFRARAHARGRLKIRDFGMGEETV